MTDTTRQSNDKERERECWSNVLVWTKKWDLILREDIGFCQVTNFYAGLQQGGTESIGHYHRGKMQE